MRRNRYTWQVGLSLGQHGTDYMVGLLSPLCCLESLTHLSDCRLGQCLQAQGSQYLPSHEVLGLVRFGDGWVHPDPCTVPGSRMSVLHLPGGGRAPL